VDTEAPGESLMSRTKCAAVWFAWGLLGMLASGAVGRADEKALPSKTISEVVFVGANQYSADELQRYTTLTKGMDYDATKAADDCAAIVRHYQEHGYPFISCSQKLDPAAVIVQEWDNGMEVARLIYTIHEGPKVKVRRVEFIGNTFVGSDVLVDQIASHKRGSSRANFAEVPADVVRLTEYYRSFGYRDVVVSYELQWNLDGGEAMLLFHIKEGKRY
jgi:outer membrane protein insertion porin family